MNKKLKKIAIVGATVIMTASSVGFSNAMQVKKVNTTKSTGKMYVYVDGKRYKLNLNCISILDTLKWFDKNNCSDKFPSIDDNESVDKEENDSIQDNDQNNGDDQNGNGNVEDNNPGNDNNQGGNVGDNDQDNDNNQDQDVEDNNPGNDDNQGGNVEDNNQNNNNNNNSTDTTDFSKEQVEVLNLVNKERVAKGLKPLTLNKELSKVATIKSKDMIDNNYFDHTSPTYGSPFDMMKAFNISYKTAGENIAMGQKTPSEVMNAWMNSSGHRANILNANFTELGVGIYKDAKGSIYWTQMFIGK
ncbi:CAP domain-containing protein [Intestinibacter sp.]